LLVTHPKRWERFERTASQETQRERYEYGDARIRWTVRNVCDGGEIEKMVGSRDDLQQANMRDQFRQSRGMVTKKVTLQKDKAPFSNPPF
jgi:hypothetical protein